MYKSSEIKYALLSRSQGALEERYNDNELALLTAIRFTYHKDNITQSGDKQYRDSFLEALNDQGVYYDEPFKNDDRKWHFYLPKIKEVTDD